MAITSSTHGHPEEGSTESTGTVVTCEVRSTTLSELEAKRLRVLAKLNEKPKKERKKKEPKPKKVPIRERLKPLLPRDVGVRPSQAPATARIEKGNVIPQKPKSPPPRPIVCEAPALTGQGIPRKRKMKDPPAPYIVSHREILANIGDLNKRCPIHGANRCRCEATRPKQAPK